MPPSSQSLALPLNGLNFDDDHVAAVSSLTHTASPNTLQVTGNDFAGSFADDGVAYTNTSISVFSATGNIITYDFSNSSSDSGPIGGFVEGYDAVDHVYLVQQIDGFTPGGPNGYVGTLDPAHWELLSTGVSLSQDASNNFNGPNLPLSFAVPEPASATMMAVAFVGFVASRMRQRAARRNKA
jgi:hypothetical protein